MHFFNLYTAANVGGEEDLAAIKVIDYGEPVKDFGLYRTPFGIARVEDLSTGCKTILNILHHPDKVVNTIESGKNVIQYLVGLENIRFLCLSPPPFLKISKTVNINGSVVTTDEEYMDWWGGYAAKREEESD